MRDSTSRFLKGDRVRVEHDGKHTFGFALEDMRSIGYSLFQIEADDGSLPQFNMNHVKVEVLAFGSLTQKEALAQIGRLKQALALAGVPAHFVEQIAGAGI